MKSNFIIILALIWLSCGNKIVYQKDGVILKRKQSKFIQEENSLSFLALDFLNNLNDHEI